MNGNWILLLRILQLGIALALLCIHEFSWKYANKLFFALGAACGFVIIRGATLISMLVNYEAKLLYFASGFLLTLGTGIFVLIDQYNPDKKDTWLYCGIFMCVAGGCFLADVILTCRNNDYGDY